LETKHEKLNHCFSERLAYTVYVVWLYCRIVPYVGILAIHPMQRSWFLFMNLSMSLLDFFC